MTMSSNIRERRQQAGLTQIELALRAGCSVQYVALLDRGYMPTRRSAPKLAAVLAALDGAAAAPVKKPMPLGDRWETIASRWNTGFSCVDIARELHVGVESVRHEMVRMRKAGVELFGERAPERLGLPRGEAVRLLQSPLRYLSFRSHRTPARAVGASGMHTRRTSP